MTLTHRLASQTDIPALTRLMQMSIDQLQNDVLSPAQVKASYQVMGMDSQLIKDGTYFVILCGNEIAGCGGWSYRETLFGGSHSQGRDPAKLDPKNEPARVRAMYTHPSFTRRGVGKLILSLCESAARDAGFAKVEMAATLSGEKLYTACGYSVLETFEAGTPEGIKIPLLRMGKSLFNKGGEVIGV